MRKFLRHISMPSNSHLEWILFYTAIVIAVVLGNKFHAWLFWVFLIVSIIAITFFNRFIYDRVKQYRYHVHFAFGNTLQLDGVGCARITSLSPLDIDELESIIKHKEGYEHVSIRDVKEE